jgi:hypothetical protein
MPPRQARPMAAPIDAREPFLAAGAAWTRTQAVRHVVVLVALSQVIRYDTQRTFGEPRSHFGEAEICLVGSSMSARDLLREPQTARMIAVSRLAPCLAHREPGPTVTGHSFHHLHRVICRCGRDRSHVERDRSHSLATYTSVDAREAHMQGGVVQRRSRMPRTARSPLVKGRSRSNEPIEPLVVSPGNPTGRYV